MLAVHTPRSATAVVANAPSLFLAGSIDMGQSVDWQSTVCEALSEYRFNIYNPRRPGFTEFDEDEQRYQINWELDKLDISDFVMVVFLGGSKSPVTMLELGMLVKSHPSNNLLVVCNESFYRYHNVSIVCERNKIQIISNLFTAIEILKGKISYAL